MDYLPTERTNFTVGSIPDVSQSGTGQRHRRNGSKARQLSTMVKNEWSDSSAGSMDVTDLDWPRHERAWGKRRQGDGGDGAAGPFASVDFAMQPGETYDDAVRRVHRAAQERFEQEYAQREQRAFALAKA